MGADRGGVEHVRQHPDRVGDDQPAHAVTDEGERNPWAQALLRLTQSLKPFDRRPVDLADDFDEIRHAMVGGAIDIAEVDNGA
ncbi:MAG TPA: hypothetical protein VMI72_17430 [Roseiarcus sp.]|nr:hypothetical protein [Roseiarcus sp.]